MGDPVITFSMGGGRQSSLLWSGGRENTEGAERLTITPGSPRVFIKNPLFGAETSLAQ